MTKTSTTAKSCYYQRRKSGPGVLLCITLIILRGLSYKSSLRCTCHFVQDDHMVHRGHAVFDTAILVEGYLYLFEEHLQRFLNSARMVMAPAILHEWNPTQKILVLGK